MRDRTAAHTRWDESARYNRRRTLPTLDTIDLGRPRLRMRNPIMAGYLEGITQALYDIYFVAVATVLPKLVLFSVPQGQNYNFGGIAAFAKSFAHTNLILAGVLEAPNKHIVRAISVFTHGQTTPVDLQVFQIQYFNFNVNRKPYQDMIIGRLPGGGGGFAALAGTFTAPQGWQISANGWPDVRNTYALAYGGVPIEQQQNFNVIVDPTVSQGGAPTSAAAAVSATNPVAGQGIQAWIILDGTLFRAVQ